MRLRWTEGRGRSDEWFGLDLTIRSPDAIANHAADPSVPSTSSTVPGPDPFHVWEPLPTVTYPEKPFRFEWDVESVCSFEERLSDVLHTVRAKQQGVSVHFDVGQNGVVSAAFKTRIDDPNSQQVIAMDCPAGGGIELSAVRRDDWIPVHRSDSAEKIPALSEPVELPASGPWVRMRRLRHFLLPVEDHEETTAGRNVMYNRCIWSADGSALFVLFASNRILRINSATWTIEAVLETTQTFRDICVCDQGVIALASVTRSAPVADRSRDSWILVEAGPREQRMFPTEQVMVLDPKTLNVKRVFRMEGRLLAGVAMSNLICIATADSLAVVDVALGMLTFAEHSPFARSGRSPALPDNMWLTADGQHLCASSLDSGRLAVFCYGLQDGYLRLKSEVSDLRVAGSSVSTTADGAALCFQQGGRPARLTFMSVLDDSAYAHSLSGLRDVTHAAADPVSHAVIALVAQSTSGLKLESDAGRENLVLIMNDDSIELPVTREPFVQLQTASQGRRFLASTASGIYDIEILRNGARWPFENGLPDDIPEEEAQVEPGVAAEFVVPETDATSASVEILLSPHWLAWAPDGSAFYAATHDNTDDPDELRRTVHRFDATTCRETHRSSIICGRTVPVVFTTQEGIVFDPRNREDFLLLSLNDLQPVLKRRTRYAVNPTGHPAHRTMAGLNNGGVVVFDAVSGRVQARASQLDIHRQLDWKTDAVRNVFATDDPDVFLIHCDEAVAFRVDGTRLVRDLNFGEIPVAPAIMQQPLSRPQGFSFRIDSTGRPPRGPVEVRNAENRVVHTISRPLSISLIAPHPSDPEQILVAAGGRIYRLQLRLL